MKKLTYLLSIMTIIISCGKVQSSNIKTETLWINSSKVPCEGMASRHCFEVQKGEVLNPNKWQLFYNKIAGFNFIPGNIYKLSVSVEKLNAQNIPADVSSLKYTLIKVITKKEDDTLRLHDIWVATSLNGKTLTFKNEENRPRLELQIAERKIYGKGTCNSFFGIIKLVTETKLEINQGMGGTMMACPKMEIESDFLSALSQVKTYKISNNNLTLFDKNNKTIIRLKKID